MPYKAVGEPLLLVSMIENCFDEFLHKPEQQLTLDIEIRIDKSELYFLMKCSSNQIELTTPSQGYKWENVLKRIELLYPGRNHFDMFTENGIANIILILEPDETSPTNKKEKEANVLS